MRLSHAVVVLALAASLVACDGGGTASSAEPQKAAIPVAYTKSFSVKGMHCDGCAKTVAKKVKALDGIAECTVDLQGERATVGMDDAKRTQSVIDVVKKLGYEVEPIDESAPAPAAEPAAPAAEPAAPASEPAAPAAEPAAPATTPAT